MIKSTKKRGPFKWFILRDGKEVDFKFSSLNQQNDYIEKCEKIWGGAPLDIEWAVNTSLFKEVYGKTNYTGLDQESKSA